MRRPSNYDAGVRRNAPRAAIGALVAEVGRRAGPERVVLVGIDGRGGAGKSTFARALAARLSVASVVEFDDFYRPTATRLPPGDSDIGGNFEWRRLRDQVLLPLSRGEEARYRRYDWGSDSMAEWHGVPARGAVVVEGNYSTREELRDLYDFRVWVDAPHDLRLARGLARDGEGARSRWLDEWMPEEERYLSAHEPRLHADLIVDGAAPIPSCRPGGS